jgi:hypothetical protein
MVTLREGLMCFPMWIHLRPSLLGGLVRFDGGRYRCDAADCGTPASTLFQDVGESASGGQRRSVGGGILARFRGTGQHLFTELTTVPAA